MKVTEQTLTLFVLCQPHVLDYGPRIWTMQGKYVYVFRRSRRCNMQTLLRQVALPAQKNTALVMKSANETDSDSFLTTLVFN